MVSFLLWWKSVRGNRSRYAERTRLKTRGGKLH